MNRVARTLAPAKLNLRLIVLSQQTTGYHDLETVFCGISLADRIEIRIDRDFRLETVEHGIDTGPPEDNLVMRAARLFFDRTGIPGGARIRLAKRIPSAAGLGGGSSDAAATLRALNVLHDQPLSPPELLECGALLGSDVPFFLAPSPFALGWGRGERLLALRPPPAAHVLVVHTGVDVPTPWAFRQLSAARGDGELPGPAAGALEAADLTSWSGIHSLARNDFEAVVTERIPRLPSLLRTLREGGAHLALLSGTGGSLFGLFSSRVPAEALRHSLTADGVSTSLCRTIRRWPAVRLGQE